MLLLDFMQEIWQVTENGWTIVWQADLFSSTNFPEFSGSTLGFDGNPIFPRLYPNSSIWCDNYELFILSQGIKYIIKLYSYKLKNIK